MLKPGDQAPEIKLQDDAGEPFQLSKLMGQKVTFAVKFDDGATVLGTATLLGSGIARFFSYLLRPPRQPAGGAGHSDDRPTPGGSLLRLAA